MDTERVRALLRERDPDLAERPLRPVAGGWDNQMWRLGDDLAVRMPRTARAPALLRKEWQWLPVLAPLLSLPAPLPRRFREPSELFPQPWVVADWVPGEPGDHTAIEHAGHTADTLAHFLRTLHVAAPGDAPANPDRGVPLDRFSDGFERGVKSIAGSGIAAAVRNVWEQALAAPDWARPPAWLHGDLHPANVVIGDGTLTGVLDFGELCGGDPATDLAAAWMLLPVSAIPRFLDAYRPDEALLRRARGWAVLRGLGHIGIGNAGPPGGKPGWGPIGRRTLECVLATTG